ncbi:MAG: NADH-ubiquinone oxidoreductase-F iron-sulfur binding region domain-containing protein [Tenuifilaceae bacterium]
MDSPNNKKTIKYFLENILTGNSQDYPKEVEDKLEVYRRNRITKPVIYIGVSSSSICAGALLVKKTIEDYITDREIDIEVITVGSLGLCSYEPIVDIQLPGKSRISFKNVTPNDIPTIFDSVLNRYIPAEMVLGQYQHNLHEHWQDVPFIDELDFFKDQNRVILANCGIIDPNSIVDYMSRGGYKALANAIRNHTYDEVCTIVEQSGLRGRAGGGYPTGTKWRKALQVSTDKRYFICNADESDPGAFMYRLLMESDPHRIVEGMIIGSYAIGANNAIIYTRNTNILTVERLENAIKQAYEVGFLGHDILESGFNLDLTIRKGPGAYVCGEETALIRSIEGKRGMPTVKPPYPTEQGLFGKPTVVNNVETVANISNIILNGANWFSAIGTENSKGTKIFSVSGKAKITCMVEVSMGTPLAKVVELAGGVENDKVFKALHIGGPSGFSALPTELNVPIDYEKLKEAGLAMGSGGIQILDDSVCIIDMVKYHMHFIQKESCGKCIPCREGSRRMLEILQNITRRPHTENGHNTLERFKGVIHLESLAEVMRDTSLCGLGQTAPNPVLRTLKLFREEYEEHIFDRKCKASICRDLRTFYIDVDKCTGCTACAKKCPTNAIIGNPRSPYFVVEDKCIGCGVCQDICKFSAVFYK